ncbi:MAG: trypsin-like peptidase domain-containing protein [bacterium]|nr:trypsin-like peptidase domain-containing protein [bacterium]
MRSSFRASRALRALRALRSPRSPRPPRAIVAVGVLAGGLLVATPAALAQVTADTDATADTSTDSSADCTIEGAIAGVLPSVFQVVTDRGLGTAFYIGNDEFLTAAHVVAGATEITAQNADHSIELTIVGADPDADIAILSRSDEAGGSGGSAASAASASTDDLQPLTIGDSTALDIGERLIIVGYPLFERIGDASVTLGVFSARVDDPDNDYVTSLQTDAAANPGNSGGPIIDICGEVVGIVTSKLVGAAVEGIAYAVAQSTFSEAMERARDLGPEDVEATIGAWTLIEFTSGRPGLRSIANFHVYTHWPRGGGSPPRLFGFCSDAGNPVVFMWWDVEELIGGAISRQVSVSLQFNWGDWEREYWVDLTEADNLDPQYAVSTDAAGFARSAGLDRDNLVSMWVTGQNNVPIGVAQFRVGGLRNGLRELGC